jgi:hypothetical protein
MSKINTLHKHFHITGVVQENEILDIYFFDKARDVTHVILFWDRTHSKTVTTLFNKFLIFCFNLLVSHPYLLHYHLPESVCEVNYYK